MGFLDWLLGGRRMDLSGQPPASAVPPQRPAASRPPARRRSEKKRPAAGTWSYAAPEDADWRALTRWVGVRKSKLAFLLKTRKPLYQTYSRAKPDGGERVIDAPAPLLKKVQRSLLRKVLGRVRTPDAAHGFCAGRSTKTNAQPHVGASTVIHADLQDFFPTIHFGRAAGVFKSIGFNKRQSTALAKLATCQGRLPQGAPTSPAIANLVCRRLDARLSGLAAKFGGSYTRYADDITLSGDESIVKLLPCLRKIVGAEGFRLSAKKTRIMRSGARQTVTGVVVNERAGLPRHYRRWLRAVVHNVAKNGWEKEARGVARFKQSVHGHISYLAQFHPQEANKLRAELASAP